MQPNSDVDVAALQAAIEACTEAAGFEPPLYQLRLRQLDPVLREAMVVNPNPLLIGRTVYERLWVIINRAVRRVVRHGVEPAVAEQNAINARVQGLLDRVIAGDAALHAELIRLRAEGRHGRA